MPYCSTLLFPWQFSLLSMSSQDHFTCSSIPHWFLREGNMTSSGSSYTLIKVCYLKLLWWQFKAKLIKCSCSWHALTSAWRSLGGHSLENANFNSQHSTDVERWTDLSNVTNNLWILSTWVLINCKFILTQATLWPVFTLDSSTLPTHRDSRFNVSLLKRFSLFKLIFVFISYASHFYAKVNRKY